MIAIKRNSREFKDIKEIFDDYANLKSGKKWIRLFSLKPYETLEHKILINDLKNAGDALYSINYDTILDYLRDRSKKLFRQDDSAVYYFKSSQKSKWIEFPFELTGKLKKKVMPLKVLS